jgi:hypothetical protein
MSDEPTKLFSLTEAEHTRAEVEPILHDALMARHRMNELDEKLGEVISRINQSGGLLVSPDYVSKVRLEREGVVNIIREALDRIQSTGCIVKDLDAGLLDFPARLNREDIYYCWRIGEDRIRFYHRQDEGFSGRKPLDPHDAGVSGSVH